MIVEIEKPEMVEEAGVAGPPEPIVLPRMASTTQESKKDKPALLNRMLAWINERGTNRAASTVHERPRSGFD